MMLDDVLGRVGTVTTSTAQTATELVEDSAVTATGKAAQVTSSTAKSPALAAAFLALAALGGIVAMRRVFAGAVS